MIKEESTCIIIGKMGIECVICFMWFFRFILENY